MKKDFNKSGDEAPRNVMVPSVRDKDGSGYDIFSLLLKDRIVVVQGQVESTMASVIIAQLKYLEHIDPTKEITMLINSPGGSVTDGLAIYDIMREMKCPIRTIGNGMQASMGSILLVGGDTRQMYPNSTLLVHQIMGGASGRTQHSDFEISAAHMANLHEVLKSIYVEHTGLNHKFWDIVGERDTILSTEQAVKIGYIHRAIINEKPSGLYAAEAVRSETGLQADVNKVIRDRIAKMSAAAIMKVINNGNAEGGIYAGLRPELVVRLAEFPEFWTEKKKQLEAEKKIATKVEKKAAAQFQKAANQNEPSAHESSITSVEAAPAAGDGTAPQASAKVARKSGKGPRPGL